MATYEYSQQYTLQADVGAQIVLTKQEDTDYVIINSSGEQVDSVTVGSTTSTSPQSVVVEIASNVSAYSNAIITCNYSPITKWSDQNQSQCEVCFNLTGDGGNSYWSVTGEPSQGDNQTIFPDPDPGTTLIIEVAIPTQQNPQTPASQQPVLDPNMVFLLDVAGNSVFFRGNAPLGAQTPANPSQYIDFPTFVAALNSSLTKATGLTLPDGGYEICVIALLSKDSESGILTPEVESFGGNLENLSHAWYPTPSSPAYPIPTLNNISGRICQWNVNPAGTPNGKYVAEAQELAIALNNWIYSGIGNDNGISTPRIFYIHCASGHDRTGMMCASYLAQKKVLFNSYQNGTYFTNNDLTETYIMGTTLNKIPYEGGQYAQNCYDLNNPTQVDPNRSRCFLISGSYDQTVCWVADALTNNPSNTLSLSQDAISGDPIHKYPTGNAYVEDYYAWTHYTVTSEFAR